MCIIYKESNFNTQTSMLLYYLQISNFIYYINIYTNMSVKSNPVSSPYNIPIIWEFHTMYSDHISFLFLPGPPSHPKFLPT